MTDTTDVVHCPTCGQRAHRSPSPRGSAAVAACWIAALTLALVGWLLGLVDGPVALSVAVLATAGVFIFAVLVRPGSR